MKEVTMKKEKSKLSKAFRAILILLLLLPTLAWSQQKGEIKVLTLQECLDFALKYNPTISLSRERIQEIIQDYNIARSGLFPTISARGYASWVDPNRLSPGGVAKTTALFSQENLASIAGRQNIFDGLKTYYGMKGAKIGEQSQREALRGTKEDILSQVYQAYYRLLEAKETLGVAQESKKQREGFRDMAEALLKAGKVTKLDFLRSDSQVIDADQTIVQAQNNIILAKAILKKTMGLRDEAEIDIPGETTKISPEQLDELTLWEKVNQKNSDLKRINLDIERAKANISLAKADYWPVISFQAGWGYRNRDIGSAELFGTGKNTFFRFFSGTADEYTYGIFLDYNIFSGGSTRAAVGKAKSVSLQLEDSKKALLDQLKVDLNTALSQIRDALKGMDSAKEAIAVNQEAYDATVAMYQAGKVTSLDVMQAQISLIISKASYVNYYANYQTALAQLRKIIGEGETFYEK